MGKRAKKENKNKKSTGTKILIIILVIVILVAGTLIALRLLGEEKVPSYIFLGEEEGREQTKEQTINIYSGTERPIAVMIDNHKSAWPQSGLNDAYIVYEIIVEGGETRLMALFKGASVDVIGPVRSARHYFIDYAIENGAIYTHYGWSPQAQSDISTYKVNHINGITESTTAFKRITQKSSPHNVMTSTKSLIQIAQNKKYDTTSEAKSILNYTSEEVNLEEGVIANTVSIPYSDLQSVSYKYSEETKRYVRYSRGTKQTDFTTKQDVTTKNIIITFAENYTLNDVENKGRQGLKNTGTLDGYYITNGTAIKITCTKSSKTDKTVYKDLQGNEINVNDGNTFIQICPLNSNIIFE